MKPFIALLALTMLTACSHRHHWSRWETIETPGRRTIQQRTCPGCGFEQVRVLTDKPE